MRDSGSISRESENLAFYKKNLSSLGQMSGFRAFFKVTILGILAPSIKIYSKLNTVFVRQKA
jgi:hypothetical protein